MYQIKKCLIVVITAFLLFPILPAAGEEMITFDKSDYDFRKNIPLLVKESIFTSSPDEVIEEPLVIISKTAEGKYLYYFFLEEVGNVCAAIVHFPQRSRECRLRISDGSDNKELIVLKDIEYKDAVGEKPVPLYIWE